MIHISDKSRHFYDIIVTAGSNKNVPKTKITLFLDFRGEKLDDKNILFPKEGKLKLNTEAVWTRGVFYKKTTNIHFSIHFIYILVEKFWMDLREIKEYPLREQKKCA